MPLTTQDILNPPPIHPNAIERIAHRKFKVPITILEPNPLWPTRFLEAKARIESALGSTALEIHHMGSTSVPNLPAKDIIDIDLVVKDILDQESYVLPLEKQNFRFLLREPAWHQHRFFADEGDREGGFLVNLHVFGPQCAEVERHRIFRDWLRSREEERELYARVKRECAEAVAKNGEGMQDYTDRKDATIETIRNRAFKELGYIK